MANKNTDLFPINIRSISNGDKNLYLILPLLKPILDKKTQLLVIEEPEFGLYVFANTRNELISGIKEQLFMMWDEYIDVNVDDLALDAKKVRNKLLLHVKEIANCPYCHSKCFTWNEKFWDYSCHNCKRSFNASTAKVYPQT